MQVQVPKLEGPRWIAIQLNAPTYLAATDINYFLTNAPDERVSAEWIASTYSQRNWVEVFYRDAKGWFGLSEYQVRDAESMKRHWILVFTAYTFILWHQLTGGVRRRWATKPLHTISETLEAFRTAVEFRRRALAQCPCRCICRSQSQVWLYLGLESFKVPLIYLDTRA